MELLISAFNIILYRPLFNALVLLYQYLPGQDFGIAVIVLTILIKILFYPLNTKTIKSQKALSRLQPKIQEIQKKYREDKEGQMRATIDLYRKEKINPFSGCLPLLIQLPILIALYRVFWKGLQTGAMSNLYSFVPSLNVINPIFLKTINLSNPSLVLAFLAGIFQFSQTKMMTLHQKFGRGQAPKTSDFSQMMQKQMLYFFPIFTVFILLKLPSALALYWTASSAFTILQQYFFLKKEKI